MATRFTDIFAVQDSISDQAARSLTLRLTGNERELMRKHYTENAEAYQSYLQGRYFWNKRNFAGFKTAIDYFQRAIKIDPNYALAYAGLADCYIRLNESGVPMAQESVPRGKAAVLKALEIDDTLAEAHATLGFIKFRHDWDFAGAEQEFRRALEMEPKSLLTLMALGLSYEQQGQNDDAIAEFKRALELSPDDAGTIAALTHALAKGGGESDARRILRQLEDQAKESYVPPYIIAIVHAGLGEQAQTLEWLERAFQDRSLRPVWLKFDPRLDDLRQEGKLISLTQRLGLSK